MITNNDSLFHEDQVLCFYDCDCYERAKLSTILKYMAELAGRDYAARGFGHQALLEQGMVFLLSRSSVAIHRMPRVCEEIRVATWEQGIKGSQFFRHFELTAPSGEVLVSGTTAWLLVDPASRRILRPEVFAEFEPHTADKLPSCELPGKLRMPEGAEAVGRRVIRFSDLDGNGHVNNSIYADIAYDVLPAGYRERTLGAFRINYQTEAVLGEELELYLAADPADPDVIYIEGKNTAGGNCFLCRLNFVTNNSLDCL